MKKNSYLKKDFAEVNDLNNTLKDTIKKHHALINNLPGIIYRCKNNRNWEMEYISDGCKNITGYSSEDFLSSKINFTTITLQEDREQVWSNTQKSLDVNKSFNLEYRVKTKDGKIKYLWEQGEGVFDANGNLIALEGYIADVTIRKKAELELKASKAKTKALLDAIPDMIFIQDRKGIYLDFFCEDLEKLHIPPEQFIGKHMKDILPEEVFKCIDDAHQCVMESGALQVTEYKLNKADALHYYEARVVLMNEHSLLTIVRDITDKKKSKLELLEAQAKTSALLQTLPDTIMVYDKYGNHLEVHAPDDYQLAAPYEDHIGKNIDDILPKYVCKIIRKGFAECERTREIQTVEYLINIKGELKHLESRITRTGNGNFLTVIRDMTSHKLAEERYKKTTARNKAMLQALPDVLYVLDREGIYLDAYSPKISLLPVPMEELLGKSIYDIFPNELCERIMKAIIQSEETKQTQVLEYSVAENEELRYYEARFVVKDSGNFLAVVRDITEKRAIDDSLYLRNSALAAIINGIVITDARQPNNPIIYANQAFKDTTGYEHADFIGKNCRFLQGDDQNQEEINTMDLAIKKGKPCHVVLRNYKKDGSLFWNEISLTPIYNNNNMLTHFIAVQNDVTARKKEEFFKNAIKEVMDIIIQHEPIDQIGDKIVETIETAIANCKASILILNKENQTLHKLSAPNIPQAFSSTIEGLSILQKKGSCGTAACLKNEVIVSNIAESALWEDFKDIALSNNLKGCWSFPIFSSNKEVLGTFAIYSNSVREPSTTEKNIIHDITRTASVAIEQHNISQALNQSTEKLAAYTEELENIVAERTDELSSMVQKLSESNINLEDQIMETKAAENEALQSKILLDKISQNFPMGFVAVINPDFKIVFIEGEELKEIGFKGLSKSKTIIDDVLGVSEKVKAKVKANVLKTFKGEHHTFEIKFQKRHYLVNTMPLTNQDDKIEHVLLVHNNITIQKKAEFKILNTLKREQELSELKSRFISMASHEFRTPLSAILTSAILINKQNEAGKEEKRLRHVSKIKSNVHNLVVILNDFLSLSKLEEGKVVAKPEVFDMINFSKSLIDEIKINKKKGQTIKFEHDASEIKAFLDPKLLRHIISNVLSNAIKYSDENKKIIIKINTDEHHLFLSVADQGIGIPEADKSNMFQRFYRAKNVTNIQGTGLGLNIVKQYTELMGGTIKFKSEINVGSTFYIEFPLNIN